MYMLDKMCFKICHFFGIEIYVEVDGASLDLYQWIPSIYTTLDQKKNHQAQAFKFLKSVEREKDEYLLD